MNTERNHPRDQNSPQVEAMMNELRANAAGVDCAATYPSNPDETFAIPAGLIPGCDDKLPTHGLLLIYIQGDLEDHPTVQKYIGQIMEAGKGHIHELTGLDNRNPANGMMAKARQICREERNVGARLNRLMVMLLGLPRNGVPDTLEMEADMSLIVRQDESSFTVERGKLRRFPTVKDHTAVLRLAD